MTPPTQTRTRAFAATAIAAAMLAACGGSSGGSGRPPAGPAPGGPRPLGLDARPSNATCVAPERPAAGSVEVALERAFPSLTFAQPLALLQPPGDAARWLVLEKGGRVLAFPNDPNVTAASVTEVIDLVDHFPLDDRSEGGLLGMAFHPDFATNGRVYLSWTETGAPLTSFVAAFTAGAGTTIDAASRRDVIRLEQPYDNHNGGHIAFGPDGYLYVGFGDGGSGGDPHGHGQDTTDMLGDFLRLDVDAATPYAIPASNPFAGNPPCTPDPNVEGASCPEIFASGFRNPWRFSFDAATGALWAGDVGEGSREEIDVVEAGGNYGWNCREGTIEFPGTPAAACATAAGFVEPVHDYPRTAGTSVTGGFVYRGAAVPALAGDYVFGDFGSGRIWRLDSSAAPGQAAEELLDTDLAISSFGEGADRELYVVDYAGGGLYRLQAAAGGEPAAPPVAAALSATGCVSTANAQLPADGLIPYDVAAPFWSDGADKERWLAVPDGATVAVGADGDFDFPAGSVLLQHFRLAGRLVETRLLMRHPDGGWAGYGYRWNEQQSDATLVADGAAADVGGRPWIFPSGGDCMRCHTAAAGFALGPEVAQLDRDFAYSSTGRTAHQLDTLDGIGVFAVPLPAPVGAALVDPADAAAPLEDRARSYLHTNCAHCHRDGGPTPSAIDLRFGLDLAGTSACDAVPQNGDLGLGAAARIVAPGDPDRSVLLARMSRRDASGMPPLATSAVDTAGAELIRAWIAALDGCN